VLLVSGGHTELVRVDGPGRYRRLGRSHDDAAGECFDKVARLLGLGYPGGPAIEAIAREGNPHAFQLPKGRVSLPEGGFHPYDFSFSGLKTAMLRRIESLHGAGGTLPLADLAASFEQVVAEVLVERSCRCAADQGLGTLVLVGGVAANRRLRQLLAERAEQQGLRWRVAPLAWCTDNAAMVDSGCSSPIELGVTPRLALSDAGRLYESQACF
jgi:N6-L-threonylcarbamoyladenine synthase